MYAVDWFTGYISRGVYTVSGPFHPFGGAVDIIVVQQPDGSFKSSPWYVKFGKFQGVLKTKEKVVSINVNGVDAEFHMYLDHKGEAYFLRELDGEQGDSVFSPLSSGDETEVPSQSGRIKKSKSGDFDANQPSSSASTDEANAKIVAKTSSRRSGILGLFGRKSMKEDRSENEGSRVGADRIGSLERAEIATELLEVKWSTNLPTIDPNMDDTLKFVVPVHEVDKDLQVNNEQSPDSLLFRDSIDNHSDLPTVNVETDTCDNSGSGPNNPESPEEVISPKEPLLTTLEQSNEISTLEAFDRCEVFSKGSTAFNEFSLGNTFSGEMAEESVSESTMAVSQNPDLVKLEAGQSTHNSTKRSSDKMSTILCNGVSENKTENEDHSSFTYCETTDISRVGIDGSFEQATETLEFSNGRCEEVEPCSELITEVTPLPDSRVLTVEEDLCGTGIKGDGYYSTFSDNKIVHENELTSVNSVTESPSPLNLHVTTLNPVGTEKLEVDHRDTVTEGLAQNDNLEPGPVEFLENESQITDHSLSSISEYNRVSLGKPSKMLVSLNQESGVNEIFDPIEAAVSQSMCTSSDRSSSSPFQWKKKIGQDDEINDYSPSLELICDTQDAAFDSVSVKEGIPGSDGSEEDQLLFGEIDGFETDEVQLKGSVVQQSMQTENFPSLTLDGIEYEHERVNINHASSLSPGKLADEYPATIFEGVIEESGAQSSPITIPKAHMPSGKNGVWLPESLPIIRHIDSLEGSDVHHHPLSHSLDSNSVNLKLGLLGQVVSTSTKPDADSEYNLAHEHPITSDTQAPDALGLKSVRSPVEISLCKHLLHEGMGADAALQAFDAEKVDLEKFTSLGPTLIKNDKLIVKIRGHYFTWDAAAPIILGMAAFGSEEIFEPEGMIAIDKVEKTLVGDPERAIVQSGGSWRLWPFQIGRSRTLNSIQPALNGTEYSDASDCTGDMIKDKNVANTKVTKKEERSIIPTSEQLATLNLEEGRNVITFTFSTAMLGRQQVDARIYLWKWNTRIVVSDVDGTITKSDVLGQFMPLVGKDWSQTGVTHLFSAIKENGYQLLFLSARAISQAYLTRQFLLNLKQDGKALPEGPVVISPDGLFPSLFREVIRRAPHEFKIACLEDIKALFPPDCNPFYAGFGNRDTDEISYLKVGIPKGKIFIINPKGEVAINRWVNTKSYTALHALVNGMFPAISSAEQEDFNSLNYWKVPLPEIDV